MRKCNAAVVAVLCFGGAMGCTALEPLGGGGNETGAEGDGDGSSGGDGDIGGDGDGGDGDIIGDGDGCVPGVPGTSQLPRLSRVQFDNTVRDLLHVDISPSSMLAPDSDGSVDQRAWDGYQQAAAAVSAAVMDDADARTQVIPCTPESDGAACAQQLIQTLGPRAFRRPLTGEDMARFQALIDSRAAITPTGSFEELAQLLIEAFLLSPSFIVRAESAEVPEGVHFALSGHEVASRLSYLIWNSMPDDALFAAAASGALTTSEGILAEATRMLGDPRARGMVEAFHEHYMHMGPGTRWEEINRDPALFPNYDDGMAALLSEETHRFIEHVVFDLQGTFQQLVTEPIGFVNSELAPLYGLPAGDFGTDLTPTPLDGTERAGLFTRLGFLASHSYYDRSSPIHRGAFIQKEIFCVPVGTPPPGAEGEPLPTEGLDTNRDRVDAQTGADGCSNCHQTFINPTGFAFESYDATGAIQTHETFSGAPINTSASVLVGGEVVDVTGPVDLSHLIANAPEAHACYAEKWVEFAYNRTLSNQDECVVHEITQKLTQGGYTVLQLIADLTQSESFRLRALETEAGL